MGVSFKFHAIQVGPGVRYTHYNETKYWLPTANAVDFLMSFTF